MVDFEDVPTSGRDGARNEREFAGGVAHFDAEMLVAPGIRKTSPDDGAEQVDIDVAAGEHQNRGPGGRVGARLQSSDGQRARPFDDHLRLFDEGDDGVGDRVVVDRDDAVHESLDQAERAVRWASHGHAVGDRAGGGSTRGAMIGERAANAIHGRRLDAGDAHLRACGLDCAGDAAEQPAAAGGHEHLTDLRALVEDFEADRALPRDDGVVIEGRDVDAALAAGDLHRLGTRLFQRCPREHHSRAIFATGGHLGQGRGLGHHHNNADPAAAASERDALRVVAGAGRDHSPRGGLGVHLMDEVGGAANLERPRELHLFALEEDGHAELRAERSGGPHRRHPHIAGDRVSGCHNPLESDRARGGRTGVLSGGHCALV